MPAQPPDRTNTGELLAHQVKQLERQLEKAVDERVFNEVLLRLEGEMKAIRKDVQGLVQLDAERRKQDNQRRNAVFGAVVTAAFALLSTLVLAGLVVATPGGLG